MRSIPLPGGRFALVDDEDFAELSKHNWHVIGDTYQHVARSRTVADSPGAQHVRMGRVLLGLGEDLSLEPDHINGDPFDNRRQNLRIATKAQNSQNRGRNINKRGSVFKGVFPQSNTKRWRVKIKVAGKQVHVGYFDDQVEAACAYNVAALHHFGDFARLNRMD